jgi:hypothetical protein
MEALSMSRNRTIIFVAAALVAGLVLGSVGIATAATTATSTTGFGARVGGVMRQTGATIADVVAKLTGQTTAQVYTQREAGKSFADIAAAKGVSADKVTADALAARKAALAAAVKAGTITQAQADAMAARQATRIPSRITDPAPANCDGTGSGAGRGGMGGGMGRGAGGGGCGGAGCAVTTAP